MGYDISLQSQNNFPRIRLPGTCPAAKSAVKATPELLGVLENPVLRPQLEVTDHLPGKMLVYQRTNSRAGSAIETFQRGISPEAIHLVGKIVMN